MLLCVRVDHGVEVSEDLQRLSSGFIDVETAADSLSLLASPFTDVTCN